jgi:hypothetical protein
VALTSPPGSTALTVTPPAATLNALHAPGKWAAIQCGIEGDLGGGNVKTPPDEGIDKAGHFADALAKRRFGDALHQRP